MAIYWLTHSSDLDFKKDLEISLPYFPGDFPALRRFDAGHGTKANGTPVNLLEHTVEVICGKFGGFGLKSEIGISTLPMETVKKVLRISALFHDIGKMYGRKGHITNSARIAGHTLPSWGLNKLEITLIQNIIAYNDFFGSYLARRSCMTFPELLARLSKGYERLGQTELAERDYRKMLFSLWIADASTLRVVNSERRHLYHPIFERLDELNYETLEEILQLKQDILGMNDPFDLVLGKAGAADMGPFHGDIL
ncbi:MAG: HD domain-containing protein [Verrucomicrobia bacterium]|nr:HD domain-containing protein [Verrucomicrobiota bacterium]